MKFLFSITNLVTIVLLLITFQLSESLDPHSSSSQPTHVHKTLLLDRNFSPDEVIFIMAAAAEWTEATNHVVEMDVIQLPNENEMLTRDSIVVSKASPDNPDILIQESITEHITLGLYTRRLGTDIVHIVGSRLTEAQYKAVVLHELGHALGLQHIEGLDGIDTLMCPYIDFGSDHITEADLKKFCELYQCSKH